MSLEIWVAGIARLREESHFSDRKSFLIKGAKVQKIAVAFANADGGEFVTKVSQLLLLTVP